MPKFVIFLLFACSANAQGISQTLGQLKVENLYIEPQLKILEGRRGGFNAPLFYLGGNWVLNDEISTHFKIGSEDLRPVPMRYSQESPRDITLVEGYGQFRHWLGTARAGVIPLPYGVEGGDMEAQLPLLRSLFFSQKLIPLRDYGASFETNYAGVHSLTAVYNGEAGADRDTEAWFLAHAYYQTPHLQLGMSATTGRTNPVSGVTATTNLSVDGFDRNRPAKWRFANLFFNYSEGGWSFQGQGNYFEVLQDVGNGNGFATNLDVIAPLWRPVYFAMRWDQLELRTDTAGDRMQEICAGLLYRSQHQNSTVGAWARRRWAESSVLFAHELLVYWKLTSNFWQ